MIKFCALSLSHTHKNKHTHKRNIYFYMYVSVLNRAQLHAFAFYDPKTLHSVALITFFPICVRHLLMWHAIGCYFALNIRYWAQLKNCLCYMRLPTKKKTKRRSNELKQTLMVSFFSLLLLSAGTEQRCSTSSFSAGTKLDRVVY